MSQEQLHALDQALRDAAAATPTEPVDRDEARRRSEEASASRPLADGFTARPGTLGGVDVLRLDGPYRSDIVVLYFHGGGYTFGSPRTTATLTSRLAARAGASAISVGYRLAPENPFPAALDDALAAYRGLLDSGVAPARIVVAGDSAGGGLAMALLIAARDAGLARPAAAVLFSPWTDLTLSGASITSKGEADLVLTADGQREAAADYADGTAPDDPLVSPLFADLAGLPPLLIQVGSHEILLDDSTGLAERAAIADVEVRLEVTAGAPHVFQRFAGSLDEADVALASAGAFIRAHVG
jgi:epsilon-lactone hydrolase